MNTFPLPLGRQNGQFVQHPSPHRLFLQHWCLPVLPWDNQSADEEKCAGNRVLVKQSFFESPCNLKTNIKNGSTHFSFGV